MNLNRRLLLALTVAAVPLAAMSATTWRSLAAPPADDPASARRQGERPESAAAALATPVPGGPGFVSQSAILFRPVHPAYQWDYFGSVELYNPGAETAWYSAPLSLPHGATITKLVVWYWDSVTSDLTVRLDRVLLSNAQCDSMAEVVSSGTPSHSYAEDASIDYAEIDLQSYAYRAYVTIPGGHGTALTLVSIRIDYAYPGYVPLAMKDQ